MYHLSLKENAYHIIKEKIFNGDLEPGMRIREDLLAEEISMSRTPVREAVNQLSAEGFIRNVSRRGLYIIEFSPDEIIELLEVREQLEILAITKCIDKITAVQLKHLQNIIDEFESMLSKQMFRECNELDSRFHQEIAAISGNKKLIELLGEIEDFMKIARSVEKKVLPKEKNQLTLQEHTRILDCIRINNKIGAVDAISVNINRMKKNLGL